MPIYTFELSRSYTVEDIADVYVQADSEAAAMRALKAMSDDQLDALAGEWLSSDRQASIGSIEIEECIDTDDSDDPDLADYPNLIQA